MTLVPGMDNEAQSGILPDESDPQRPGTIVSDRVVVARPHSVVALPRRRPDGDQLSREREQSSSSSRGVSWQFARQTGMALPLDPAVLELLLR